MFSKDNEEGFLAEMPPIPEDEFCVYGTVRLHNFSQLSHLAHPEV